jgi:hypothetical protein
LACTNRDNAFVVIAATEGGGGLIYPRKGGDGNMGEGGGGGGGCGGERVDLGLLHDYVRLGVAEMVNRAADRAEANAVAAGSSSTSAADGDGVVGGGGGGGRRGAVIASALSMAMCSINRFMVASNARGGVLTLADASASRRGEDAEGVLALMGRGRRRRPTFVVRTAIGRVQCVIAARSDNTGVAGSHVRLQRPRELRAFAANKA